MEQPTINLDAIVDTLDNNGAMRIIALFFAQPELEGKKPHELLNFSTREAALTQVSEVIHRKVTYIKNVISYFDKHTGNHRKGWGGELTSHNKSIYEKYSEWTTADLLNLVQVILAAKWTDSPEEQFDDLNLLNERFPDLTQILTLVDARLERVSKASALNVSDVFLNEVKKAYELQVPNDDVTIIEKSTFEIKTPDGNYVYVSTLELARCWATLPYVNALQEYILELERFLKEELSAQRNSGDTRDLCKELPNSSYKQLFETHGFPDVDGRIDSFFDESEHAQRFKQFLSDKSWSGIGKKLNRDDLLKSSIIKSGRWLALAADRRGDFSIALATISAADAVINSALQTKEDARVQNASSHLHGGENVVFYGAPGTGKSYRVDEAVRKTGREPFRTVFHPDLQNSDFFGCLKPRMHEKNVHYEFAPGPFMEAMVEAYKTPHDPVYLVIEELNRAAAAAVFGDLFLLLDRDDSGAGEYSVSFPSPESRDWFETETGVAHERIKLPSNLFIYATMNSADQGVYPIDTAFRRRWRQEYLPLEYKAGPDGEIAYVDANDKRFAMQWRNFVKVLNDYLVRNHSLTISEDRLLGQWFVKKKELDGLGIPEKVLLYLWDDLLRHEGREQIFDTGTITTYGALDRAAKTETRLLSNAFLGELNAISKAEPESVDVDDAG